MDKMKKLMSGYTEMVKQGINDAKEIQKALKGEPKEEKPGSKLKKRLIWAAIAIIVIILCIPTKKEREEAAKPQTYVEAVKLNDFTTAHEILDRLMTKAIEGNASGSWAAEDYLEEFWAAADHIYKAEMMYLIEMQDSEANKRLVNTLAMMNVIGDKPTSSVLRDFHVNLKAKNYSIFVTRYNRLCDEILNISIINNNKEMAKTVLNMYKDDCVFLYDKEVSDGYTYHYDLTVKSKPAALKKYNEAIKNGLLS